MYFPHAFRKSFLPATVANTTLSTATLGTTTGKVLAVSSATGIVTGQSVSVASGAIPSGAIVTGISGTNITISLPITAAIASGVTVTFGGGTATPTLSTALNAPNVLQFASTTGVSVGMTVTGTSIPSNTTVTAVSSTLVTLSNSVTATISTSASISFGSSVSSLASGSTAALTAGQIGFFAADGSAVQSASAKPFIIAGGSYFKQDKIGPVHGGYKESWKSKLINPKYISRVIKVVGKTPMQNVVQVPVSCGLTCDTTYRLRIDVKGSPALRFLSHNMYRVLDSYTGCCNTTDPTLQKDPVVTLLNWADQINLSLIFNTMVQARVYKLAVSTSSTAADGTNVSVTQATFVPSSFTSVAVGQKVVGTGIPANSFVTTVNGTTNITITYPTQTTAPAASVFNNITTLKFYSDIYSGAVGTPQSGDATIIPGTGTQSGVGGSAVISTGVATGGTVSVYSASADAASFSVDAHIELTAAYIETKFGTCTFTPTDKYDLEPLLMYTAIVDETGDPCSSFCFTTTHANTGTDGTANTNTVIQAPVQANGVGETVLRDLILSNRYLQNAYPDSGRVESLRMREIEIDPMIDSVSRTSYYDQVMVLHNVPRFNNPTGTFDNDQYLLVFYVPTGTSTVGLTNYLVSAVSAAGGTIPTNSAGGNLFEQY
jgi:hypothetical protein